uniref:Uncharacterized protein LOC113793011 n=1 Tax=Dermatophagoides pteronyssinus TaxID=6956 RepID=A0A6P6XZQ2_DERPT|nr:uncharacterized protein LOC113793011 [Dermatophagoides pteronyssinus]
MAKKFKLNRESRDQIESIHNNLLEMQNEILLDPSNVSLNDIRIRLIGYRDDLDKIMLNFDERKKLENLCFSKFDGQQFSLLNLETKCIKNIAYNPVEDHDSPIIYHSEGCHDFHSKPIWKITKCMPKHLIIPENIVQIKHDEDFIYFYCYTQNVTLFGVQQQCKNKVYQIEKDQDLTINNMTTKFMKINIQTSSFIQTDINQLINNVKFQNFDDSINLERLDSLVQTEHEMIERMAENIFSYHQTKLIVIGFISFIIIMCIIIFLFAYYLIRMRNFQRVAREQYQLATIRSHRIRE